MSPAKTAYVLQQGSSQRDEPQANKTVDRNMAASRRKEKRANMAARCQKSFSVLKVKLPNFSIHRLSKKKATKDEGKTPGRWMLEPAASKPRTPAAGTGDSQGNVM